MTKTLFELAGGTPALTRLASEFYDRVLADSLLRPLFRDPTEDHAGRLAHWLIELTGGPPLHSESRGGFATMVRAHAGLGIAEEQRRRWVEHMRAACQAAALPPDVASALLDHLEGVSYAAMRQSRRAG